MLPNVDAFPFHKGTLRKHILKLYCSLECDIHLFIWRLIKNRKYNKLAVLSAYADIFKRLEESSLIVDSVSSYVSSWFNDNGIIQITKYYMNTSTLAFAHKTIFSFIFREEKARQSRIHGTGCEYPCFSKKMDLEPWVTKQRLPKNYLCILETSF